MGAFELKHVPDITRFLQKRWDFPSSKAEEVFIIVRELSTDHGHFTWKKWYDACVAVMNPSKHQLQAGFKCTVGSMLRAQVKHGTIVRQKRGRYFIASLPGYDMHHGNWKRQMPRSPLYVQAGRFNMTPEDKRDWRPESKIDVSLSTKWAILKDRF